MITVGEIIVGIAAAVWFFVMVNIILSFQGAVS